MQSWLGLFDYLRKYYHSCPDHRNPIDTLQIYFVI